MYRTVPYLCTVPMYRTVPMTVPMYRTHVPMYRTHVPNYAYRTRAIFLAHRTYLRGANRALLLKIAKSWPSLLQLGVVVVGVFCAGRNRFFNVSLQTAPQGFWNIQPNQYKEKQQMGLRRQKASRIHKSLTIIHKLTCQVRVRRVASDQKYAWLNSLAGIHV